MNEEFLHYVWQYQLLSIKNLQTTNKESLVVVKPGTHNLNSGPDFLNSEIIIENQYWVGNVEIHLHASDWYQHHHETDKNYDATILHVVWFNDVAIFMKNNLPIPVLVLQDCILSSALNNYQNLFTTESRWILCEKEINNIDSFILNNWKERLFFERLERKSNEINTLLMRETHNFEAVLFQLLAKNFGLKINQEAFLRLAQSIDFSIIQKVSFNQHQFSALLFGQAGFLEQSIEDEYYLTLKKEYNYLKHKYQLEPISSNLFSFFRMRPNNFPTIRIAQLVSLYNVQQNLFSKIMEIDTVEDFYTTFSTSVPLFWKTHYSFESNSKLSSKKLTKSFIDLLIINTIIPLKFLYQKSKGAVDEDFFLTLLQKIKPEKNNIISKFSALNMVAKNAFDTQALLELKNNYCTPKRCLACAIGLKVLER